MMVAMMGVELVQPQREAEARGERQREEQAHAAHAAHLPCFALSGAVGL
jgi:hypothetical protein